MGRDDEGTPGRDVLGTHRGRTEVATRELLDREELPLGGDRVEATLIGRVLEEQVAGDRAQIETVGPPNDRLLAGDRQYASKTIEPRGDHGCRPLI
jgi:hypothetical protein